MKNKSTHRVLVIGGGMGGATAAKRLRDSGKVQVTLVDRKDFFEIPYAQLRGLVDPTMGERSRHLYADLFGADFVNGTVVRLTDHEAELAGGVTLPFDYVLLAPGGQYPAFPYLKAADTDTLEARRQANEKAAQRNQTAKGFWVVGGGVVGVELAGELAAAYPGVPVRLVHKGTRLVENLSEKASGLALAHLKDLGVEVRFGVTAAEPAAGEEVFHAVSSLPATAFLPEAVLKNGRIAVDDQLRVAGHPHWYAFGDAADTGDVKHGAVATMQAGYVVKHLLATLRGRPWKPYEGAPAVAMVPIGRTKGFLQAPFGVVAWKWVVDMKRKDFFTGMLTKSLASR